MVAPWKLNHTGPIIEKQPRMIRQGCLSCLGYSEAKDEPQKFLRALFFEQGGLEKWRRSWRFKKELERDNPNVWFLSEKDENCHQRKKIAHERASAFLIYLKEQEGQYLLSCWTFCLKSKEKKTSEHRELTVPLHRARICGQINTSAWRNCC